MENPDERIHICVDYIRLNVKKENFPAHRRIEDKEPQQIYLKFLYISLSYVRILLLKLRFFEKSTEHRGEIFMLN